MEITKSEAATVSQFCIQFTLFLSLWNQAESTARRILQLMLGESQTAMALAVEMQNRSLSNALNAGAKDPKFKKVRGEIEHLTKGYDTLLGHRNYHAHSPLGVNGGGGILLSVSAKGRIQLSKAQSTMADMEKLKMHIDEWIAFAAAIEKELGATGDGLDALIAVYKSSLQKPTWPQKIAKPVHWLQEP